MSKRFLSLAKSSVSSSDSVVQNPDAACVQECLEQAEICCEQARSASRCRRFGAAVGLFSTAAVLCRRALSACKTDENGRRVLQQLLECITSETAVHAQLARSMQRPMRAPVAVRAHLPSSTRNDKTAG